MRTTESFRHLKRMQVIKAARHGSKSALFVLNHLSDLNLFNQMLTNIHTLCTVTVKHLSVFCVDNNTWAYLDKL